MDNVPAAESETRVRGDSAPWARRGPAVRAGLVALLSFLWPGLGHHYLGYRGRALAFALPPLGLAAGFALAVVQSPQIFALRLLVPAFAYGVLALVALHAGWRVAALFDGWRLSRRSRPLGGRDQWLAATLGLSVLLVLAHAAMGTYILSINAAAAPIFRGGDDFMERLGPEGDPGGAVIPTPTVDQPPAQEAPLGDRGGLPAEYDGRLTVLIVGIDSAPGRGQSLTDTLIVASYELGTNEVVMISIPRDVSRMPIYTDAPYAGKINGFLSHTRRNPDKFPEGPLPSLVHQVEHLIGVDIDYYAATDMAGLEGIVDMVGGVTVTLERPIRDHFWDFYMEPGDHHLDGPTAMIYVRSRFGPGNSDFERARRQQDVVRALLRRGSDPAVLARLPEVLRSAAQTIRTDMPPERLPDLLSLLDQIAAAETQQVVLRPPRYARRVPREEAGGVYMIELRMDAVSELSIELFGEDSHYHERVDVDNGTQRGA